MYSADPIKDFEHYDTQQARWLARRPVCAVCGEHIQEDLALRLWGEWICGSCVRDNAAWVDEYLIDE